MGMHSLTAFSPNLTAIQEETIFELTTMVIADERFEPSGP